MMVARWMSGFPRTWLSGSSHVGNVENGVYGCSFGVVERFCYELTIPVWQIMLAGQESEWDLVRQILANPRDGEY